MLLSSEHHRGTTIRESHVRVKEPLYSVIANRAEARIRTGEWPPGTRLPPERELCRLLDVSRVTLRQAFADLEERGLISRHQGRGTFVTRPRVQTPLTGFFSIGEALRARGIHLTTRVLAVETVPASRQVAHDLGCLPGDQLVRLDRLRLIETEPLVLESSHLPLELFPNLDSADFVSRSLYDVLREDYGRTVNDATETIEPVITTPRESALLGLPRHAPAILTRRVTRDRSGTIVELGQALLRGDRSSFLLQRHVRDIWVGVSRGGAGASVERPGQHMQVPIVADLLEGDG
ncbi:transcriptional regulator NagR [soil metagenome]